MHEQRTYSWRLSSGLFLVGVALLSACAYEDEVVPSAPSDEALGSAAVYPGDHEAEHDPTPRALVQTVELQPGVPVPDLAGARRSDQRFHLAVPAGAQNLVVRIGGGTGDADLYVRFGEPPTTQVYDGRSQRNDNDDSVRIAAPSAGTYHVLIRGYRAYSGVTLTASFDAAAPTPDAGVPDASPPPPPDAGAPDASPPPPPDAAPPPPPDAAPPPPPDAATGGLDCRNPATWPADWTAFEDRVLVLINQRRAAGATCGGTAKPPVGPVVMNEDLREAARCHSLDMAVNNYFSHDSQDGRSPWDRIAEAGYTASPTGENIAAGYGTPEAVVEGWMTSSGHCNNIMNGGSNETGLGYALRQGSQYGRYWTQTFGRRR